MNGLLDFLQGASNAAASNVSGPVDLIGMGLRKLGVPVPQNALLSSQWMEERGLTRKPKNALAAMAGETVGLLSPVVAAAKAPHIARGLLDTADDFQRYNQALGPAGASNVVPPSFVRQQGGTVNLPADELFTQAVASTPGASVVDDGLLIRLQRNQRPEQGMMPSTRGGVFYLPEGASQAKHYSTGKNGYGGSERVSGETLVQNPVFVKGATGGKAPEAAFDKLMGKGAYQSMRNDALKVYGQYGSNKSQRAALADEFLDKYAPEMSGMGHYIVENSGQGNQLAYALQEAAVGSAVRAKGHDAVLGYSKAKNGNPFISEIFDVREQAYPDKFGSFRVWGE